VLNSFIMSLPLRKLIFDEEQRLADAGMTFLTLEEMKMRKEAVPYSSELVKQYFFSIVHHLKHKGRIMDNSPVINNLALQIKRNYYTIYDLYKYKKDQYEKYSKIDRDHTGGDSDLSLLEIIKTFTDIDYNFLDIDNNHIITNSALLALGMPFVFKYDETKKEDVMVHVSEEHENLINKNISKSLNPSLIIKFGYLSGFGRPNYIFEWSGNRYIIQSAIIKVYASQDKSVFDPIKINHVITGYVCNGVQYIHDPNNHILQMNWIRDKSKTDNLEKLKKYIRKEYFSSHPEKSIDVELYFRNCIYLREDIVLKIERETGKSNGAEYGNHESDSIRRKVVEKGKKRLIRPLTTPVDNQVVNKKSDRKRKESTKSDRKRKESTKSDRKSKGATMKAGKQVSRKRKTYKNTR